MTIMRKRDDGDATGGQHEDGRAACREFERDLDAIAAAEAPAPALGAAEAHAARCPSCRGLLEAARASLAAPSAPPPDLTAGILSLTSGPACGAAGDRMAGFVDGELGPADRELMRSHLDGCAECAALAGAMSELSVALPALAAVDPGEEFTRAVMRATVEAVAARGAARAAAVHAAAARPGALAAWWSRLTARPRFPWEAAYVGALALWLLFGAAFSPFHEVPSRALELAQVDPLRALGGAVQPASLGRQVWEATGAGVMKKAEASTAGLADRSGRVKEASASLARHGADLMGSMFRGDLSGGAVRLKDVGGDLKGIWDGLWGSRPEGTEEKKPKGQEA